MPAAVDEVRFNSFAPRPLAHRAPVALPVTTPHRPGENDFVRPDLVEHLSHAVAAARAHEIAPRPRSELVVRDLALLAHLVNEVHHAGLLQALDLMGRETHANSVPGELRDRQLEFRGAAGPARRRRVDPAPQPHPGAAPAGGAAAPARLPQRLSLI